MFTTRTNAANNELRWLLIADSAMEAACGAALLLWRSEMQSWFGFSETAVYVLAAVFLLAAIVPVGMMLANASSQTIATLAWANLAGGAAGWLVLPVVWGYLEPEGRWIAAATFDAFLALGIAELLALRRAPVGAS